MTDPAKPNHFDPRRVFLNTRWNIFMLLVSLLALWFVGTSFANAYASANWWAVAGWGVLGVVLLQSAWTSASRLWRGRQPR